MRCFDVEWINMFRDKDKYQALVNVIMSLMFHKRSQMS